MRIPLDNLLNKVYISLVWPILKGISCIDHHVEQEVAMPSRESPLQSETPQGTLDMLVLRVLVMGPAHGHTIAHAIERGSEDVLQIEHGSLYPALHRLENRGWIASFWGTSDNNRKAKYYRLTPTGRKQLAAQTTRWEEIVRAIGRILKPSTE
jgi:PadR family transcriptional regulator, regulatory protein PadR